MKENEITWSNLPEIKGLVKKIALEVLNDNIINTSEYESILDKLNKDVLTIGIIGQMKSGKSTLLNALLFGDDVLPVSTTPMTSSLSVLKYGSQKKITVDFYSRDEWEDIQRISRKDGESLEIKASKELVENSEKIKDEIDSLLGNTMNPDFDNLVDFVGENGKYVSITKCVNIEYPLDMLKDVEIVDTPGLNDPVASREERAAEFLNKADVVILVLYAGRPFDETDRNLLFDKIRMAGSGKIIIAVNKYDMLELKSDEGMTESEILKLDEGMTESEIKEYCVDKINQEVSKINDDKLIEDIFKNPDPVLISSLMALIAKMNVNNLGGYKWYYDEYKKKYPLIETADDFLKKSKIAELEMKIDNVVKNEKLEILVKKPLSEINGKISKTINDYDFKLSELQKEENSLNMDDEDIRKEIEKVNKAQKEIVYKVKETEISLKDYIGDLYSDSITKLRKERDKEKTAIISKLQKRSNINIFIQDSEDYVKEWNVEVQKLLGNISTMISEESTILIKNLKRQINLNLQLLDTNIFQVCNELAPEYTSEILNFKKKICEEIESISCSEDTSTFSVNYEPNIIEKSFIRELLDYSFTDELKNLLSVKPVLLEKTSQWLNAEFLSLDKIKDLLDPFKQASKNLIGNLSVELCENLVRPIIKGLENAQKNRAKQDERKIEIQNEIAEIKQNKLKLESKRKQIQIDLDKIINN